MLGVLAVGNGTRECLTGVYMSRCFCAANYLFWYSDVVYPLDSTFNTV